MPPVPPLLPAPQGGRISFSDLSDFALGHLSPAESLKMLDRIENDAQASKDLEFVVGLIGFAGRNPSLDRSDVITR
jgi:hypothetical protein